jgi:hypothetical protein
MPGKFGTETWCADRGAFIFRYQEPLRGHRWTFSVAQSALADLATMQHFSPGAIFDIWRLKIYSAAHGRMKIANPRAQQDLTSQDIRRAATALPVEIFAEHPGAG